MNATQRARVGARNQVTKKKKSEHLREQLGLRMGNGWATNIESISMYRSSLNKSANINLFRAYQSDNKSQGLQRINNQHWGENGPGVLRPVLEKQDGVGNIGRDSRRKGRKRADQK